MKKHFRSMALCLLGALAFVLGVCLLFHFGVIPERLREAVSGGIIKLCLGLIVLIVDLLCILGLIQPYLSRRIDINGEKTASVIQSVDALPLPTQINESELTQKARFSITASYRVGGKDYKKQFPPTVLTNRRELYPVLLEEGESLPIKYSKKHPRFAIIDIEPIKSGAVRETETARIHLILIPLIITAAYLALILIK